MGHLPCTDHSADWQLTVECEDGVAEPLRASSRDVHVTVAFTPVEARRADADLFFFARSVTRQRVPLRDSIEPVRPRHQRCSTPGATRVRRPGDRDDRRRARRASTSGAPATLSRRVDQRARRRLPADPLVVHRHRAWQRLPDQACRFAPAAGTASGPRRCDPRRAASPRGRLLTGHGVASATLEPRSSRRSSACVESARCRRCSSPAAPRPSRRRRPPKPAKLEGQATQEVAPRGDAADYKRASASARAPSTRRPARRRARRSATRSCASESRSRTVTVRSSSVWWSIVTHYGVPISSWRR